MMRSVNETEVWRARLRLRAEETRNRRLAAAAAERERRRRRAHGMVDRQAARLARRDRRGTGDRAGPAEPAPAHPDRAAEL